MLLDFAVYNPLDDPRTHVTIRSCTVDALGKKNAASTELKRDINVTCVPTKHEKKVEASLQLAWLDSPQQGNVCIN
jgi:hypothetical protein